MAGKIIDEDVLKLTVQNLTQLIADHVYEEIPYQDSEIDNMFDGTPEQISYYESLINDSLTSENRLWSSKKIADEVAKAIIDSNAYADGLITNISSIELKYTDTLPSTGNANTIYILKSTTSDPDTLNLYNDGSWIKIGDFNINLDDYATTDYVNTKLSDKANSSEVLAVNKVQTTTGSETNDTVYSSKLTKDELDKKVNITDLPTIATALNNMSTNNDVAGAKAVYDELLKIANDTYIEDADNPTSIICKSNGDTLNTPYKEGLTNAAISLIISVARGSDSWNSQISISMASNNIYVRNKGATGWCGWKKFLTETDFTTKINKFSTDTQIPSAKTVYNTIISGTKITSTDSYGSDIIYFPCGVYTIVSNVIASSLTNLPTPAAGILTITSINPNVGLDSVYGYMNYRYETYMGDIYYRTAQSSVSTPVTIDYDTGWQRVCATTVADVGITNITSFSSNYTSGTVSYMIKNGMCHVSIIGLKLTSTGYNVPICGGMPTPALGFVDVLAEDGGNLAGNIMISGDGQLTSHYHDATKNLHCTFSYPVAE